MKNKPDIGQNAPSWWRQTFGMRCREASELITQSMERPLARREKIFLGAHLCSCRWCRRFRSQTRVLSGWVQVLASQDAPHTATGLSTEARERIAAKLRGNIQ